MKRENVQLKHARPERSYWMFLLAGELYPLSKEAPTKRRAINHARLGISNGGQNLDQSKAETRAVCTTRTYLIFVNFGAPPHYLAL